MKKANRLLRFKILILVVALLSGMIPSRPVFAASPLPSPVIESTTNTTTYQSSDKRTGITNTIQRDTLDTGNYQINEVVKLSNGYLYLGFDNTSKNELVRKINFDGTFVWQNTSFSDLAGTTQIRGAVEVNNRLFITGYMGQLGFICELNPVTGELIASSTKSFSGRANGAVTDGDDNIYIAGSKGIHTYKISTQTVSSQFTDVYLSSLTYVPETESVVAVNLLMEAPYNNILLEYNTSPGTGDITSDKAFFEPAYTDYIWSIKYMNGYLYAVGQEGSYYVRKFTVAGDERGIKPIISELDSTHENYHTTGMFSNANSAYFDTVNNKIYFLGTSNYPNREGNPLVAGLDTGSSVPPFNTLKILEFTAGSADITDEFIKSWELLDLNLHSVSGIDIDTEDDLVLHGTTQQGNAVGDTTNRMFYLTADLNEIEDKAPQVTVKDTIVSYTNMNEAGGLVTNDNIKDKLDLTVQDDRTTNDKLLASFKLFENVPTTGIGTSDVYFSITDQIGNKTIGKTTLIREKQVTALAINGPAEVIKFISEMSKANYTAVVTPFDATDQEVVWSSSTPSVTSINQQTGELTAIGSGSTTITAQSSSNPAVSATKEIRVKNLYDMSVSPSNGAMDVAWNGNVVVTFEEVMSPISGTVFLNDTLLGPGLWSNGGKTYTIPYAGLSENTLYTIKIQGFLDSQGFMVSLNHRNSFTTISTDKLAVASAYAAATNATFGPMVQADATDESVILAYIENNAAIAVNNSDVAVAVNKVSYTEAVAGNSANAVGVNGTYGFTITVSKGAYSQTTTQKTLVITATAYTGVTDVDAVAAAKGAVVDGSVNVAYGATQELKTAAVQTYVNELIAVISDAAGVTATVNFESGNSYGVSFIKGSVTDSKTINMTVVEAPDPDIAIAEAALATVRNATYPDIAQSTAINESMIQAYIKNIAVMAVNNSNVAVTVNKVSYTEAIAGNSADADGTNGSYVFTVTVNKGSHMLITEQKAIDIFATLHAFTVTVENGTGGGQYTVGTVVSIIADAAPPDQVFDKWISNNRIAFQDELNARTTFVMPESDITVTASYKSIKGYITRKLVDVSTGIMVSGNIREDAILNITEMALDDDEACEEIQNRLNNSAYTLLFGKNLSLSQGFIGTLTITLPVDEKYNSKTVSILHCTNGVLETYTATVTNGKVVFDVTSLSPFAVFAEVTKGSTDPDDAPGTGDLGFPWGWWLLSVAALTGTIALAIMARKKRQQIKR